MWRDHIHILIGTLSRVCGLRADRTMEGRHGIVAVGLLPYLRMSQLTTLR